MTRPLTAALAVLLLAGPALAGKKKEDTAASQPAPTQPATQPAADDGGPSPSALYNYREAHFKAMGSHMKALGMIAKGKVEFRKNDAVHHAQALHGASAVLVDLFPEGSGPDAVPETEALAEIWQDWDGFKAKAAAYGDASKKLVDLAEAGDVDGFKEQQKAVGATCGGCHDAYRKGD